jgi:transcriptional regulator with XRE-family HTH domain
MPRKGNQAVQTADGEPKPAAAPNVALNLVMKAKGMSPRKLAGHVGRDEKTVQRWLDGETVPQKANARNAAKALGVRPEQLWPEMIVPGEPADSDGETISRTADLTAVFLTRNEFLRAVSLDELFGTATDISLSGLSLNLLSQHYPDTEIIRLLKGGTTIRALFLDPAGRYIADRETEEDHSPEVLSGLTKTNIATLRRIQNRLPTEATENLQLRTYDEPLRFNLTLIDGTTCIVQTYLPHARGMESPTLMIEKQDHTEGLLPVFTYVFEYYWNRGKPIT